MSRRQEYPLSDIEPLKDSDHYRFARATLAPLISASAVDDSSTFHRALHLFNSEHLSSLTWDELTVPQQDEVRALMRELQRRRHVCR